MFLGACSSRAFLIRGSFLRFVQARLSDMVIQYHELAGDRRVPVPRVAWLQVVMRADSVYGFEGDDNHLLRAILRGKISSLFQYSECLRQHAVNRIVMEDEVPLAPKEPVVKKEDNPFKGLPKVVEEGEVMEV